MEKVEQILKELCMAIYQERDLKKIFSYFREDVVIRGISDNLELNNKALATEFISAALPKSPAMKVEGFQEVMCQKVGEECFMTSVCVIVSCNTIKSNIQVSACFVQEKVLTLHMSVPFANAVESEQLKNSLMRQKQMQQQLEDVIHNVPGAVCFYHWDGKRLNPIVISDKYSEMLGTDAKEALERTQGIDFLHVHPDDLLELQKAVMEGLTKTNILNYTYRSFNEKLEKYLWINVQGKAVVQADGTSYVYVSYMDISKEKENEEKLHENEQAYAAATNRTGIWYWTYDAYNDTAYIGERAQRELHMPSVMNHFIEYWFQRVQVSEEHKKMFLDMIEQIKEGKHFVSIDIKGKIQDGTRHWVRIELSNIFDENGNPAKAIGSMHLIDDLKDMEEKYELERRKQDIEDKNLLAYFSYNISQDTIIEKKISDTLVGDIEKSILEEKNQKEYRNIHKKEVLLEKYAAGETDFSRDVRCRLANGRIVWVKITIRMLRKPNEVDILMFEHWYDINKEKSFNLMMQFAANDEYDLIGSVNYLDGMGVMLYGETSYSYPNEEENLFEERYEQAMLYFADNGIVKEEREEYKQKASLPVVKKELLKNNAYEMIFHVKKDGMIFDKKIRYINYEGVSDMCLFMQTDITEQVRENQRKQKELQLALDAAKEANQAKTNFLSNMSHDMRTPMNGILGVTALLRDETNLDKIKDGLNQIALSGKYLLDLINDTLDMNRIELGKLELHIKPMNSEDLFKNIFGNIQILAKEKNIRLDIQIPKIEHGNWKSVMADSSRVEQILMNIISNAVKYTPEGGTVTIIMNTVSITEEMVVDRYIIRDTGIGMSEEFLPHLFEAFSQEGRMNVNRQEGTGLGMSIVKRLIEMMNGEITVKSKKDEGTEVTLLMRYPVSKEEKVETIQKNVNLSVLKGKKVLLCEDHPLNRKIAIALLQKVGMHVISAENGQIGVEAFAHQDIGYFDIILMDIRMPVLNGLQATKMIRSLDRADAKTIPIIAMTANAFEDDIKNCFEAGMNEHLSKPFDTNVFYQSLARQIERFSSKNER